MRLTMQCCADLKFRVRCFEDIAHLPRDVRIRRFCCFEVQPLIRPQPPGTCPFCPFCPVPVSCWAPVLDARPDSVLPETTSSLPHLTLSEWKDVADK